MKIQNYPELIVLTLVAGFVLVFGCFRPNERLPDNPNPNYCMLSEATINSWFKGGRVSLNGEVLPADGLNFNVNDDDNCGFMKWGLQMFLYLTSPTNSDDPNSKRRFETGEFFDVSTLDEEGRRSFVVHEKNFVRTFWEREAQVGFQRLPLVQQLNTGRYFELHETMLNKAGNPIIYNKMNEIHEIAQIDFSKQKMPIFRNFNGEEIFGAHPIFRDGLQTKELIQKFEVGGVEVILDQAGNQFFAAEGQAGGHQVLMAQNGSLVYYTTIVNDAFAFFRTKLSTGEITDETKFPTTVAEIDAVSEYAGRRFGKALTNRNNLIIELKLSWIDATGLESPERYILTEGQVNTYDQSNPKHWVKNGTRRTILALVGMHIVASVKGHPEMLWATFEHRQAAPNAQYRYINQAGIETTVDPPVDNWLFYSSTAGSTFNVPHMRVVKDSILAIEPYDIGPSNTVRVKPWGVLPESRVMNSIMVRVNNQYASFIHENDARRNYLIIGNVWTIAGRPPARNTIIGSTSLANVSMETYQQDNTRDGSGTNCFTCHRTNTHKVSHVFESLRPLER